MKFLGRKVLSGFMQLAQKEECRDECWPWKLRPCIPALRVCDCNFTLKDFVLSDGPYAHWHVFMGTMEERLTKKSRGQWRWRQSLGWYSHKSTNKWNHRNWMNETREGSPQKLQGQNGRWNLAWLRWNCKHINFCSCKPPSLQDFAMATPGRQHRVSYSQNER